MASCQHRTQWRRTFQKYNLIYCTVGIIIVSLITSTTHNYGLIAINLNQAKKKQKIVKKQTNQIICGTLNQRKSFHKHFEWCTQVHQVGGASLELYYKMIYLPQQRNPTQCTPPPFPLALPLTKIAKPHTLIYIPGNLTTTQSHELSDLGDSTVLLRPWTPRYSGGVTCTYRYMYM